MDRLRHALTLLGEAHALVERRMANGAELHAAHAELVDGLRHLEEAIRRPPWESLHGFHVAAATRGAVSAAKLLDSSEEAQRQVRAAVRALHAEAVSRGWTS